MDTFLKRDLGVQQFQRLCLYSNGEVYAFNSNELCPLQIDEDESPRGFVKRPKQSFPQTGLKSGEYIDGNTKVCVYDLIGKPKSVRMNIGAICPLTFEF